MRFPQNTDGTINEKEAQKLLDTAIKAGVNYIDTAYPYHNGESEPFLGRTLKKYPRESFYLATKLPMWDIKTSEDVKKIFYKQLERLQTDYVDFYLIHCLDKEKMAAGAGFRCDSISGGHETAGENPLSWFLLP